MPVQAPVGGVFRADRGVKCDVGPFFQRKVGMVQGDRTHRHRFFHGYREIITAPAAVGCHGVDPGNADRTGVDVAAGIVYACNGGIVAVPGHLLAVGVFRAHLGVRLVVPATGLQRDGFRIDTD